MIWPELWSAFEPHRKRVCKILRDLTPGPNGRLCVLGSGRTTDLDLIELVKYYALIELYELDASITQQALVQRGFDGHPQVKAHEGVDVTRLAEQWNLFRSSADEAILQTIVESSRQPTPDLEQYDVVASTCLLSQILKHAVDCLTNSGLAQSVIDEYLPGILGGLRGQHLELLLDHTVSGGSAILITDLTSSEALPEMLSNNANLDQLLSTKVMQGNHFHGLGPRLISASTQSPQIANKLKKMQVSKPWVWDSLETQYLCVAIRLVKR